MKLALVHDWLLNLGGAERVLIELHKMYPKSPIYVLFYDKKFAAQHLPDAEIRASYLNSIPFIKKIYPALSFLMPLAIESFDLNGFDKVLSSSVTFSKGLVLPSSTTHICYCYSPARFLWDRHIEYGKGSWATKVAQHLMRVWDGHAAQRVDQFIAISDTVKQRIKKYYRRDSEVIYPPVQLAESNIVPRHENYFFIASRLHDYKNINLAVEAFNKLGYPLVIAGDGPAKKALRAKAHSNITFLGHVDDATLAAYYKHSKAFIMPQEEDFGITPIEAMLQGKPVLALRRGGAKETMVEGVTGEFFDDAMPEGLMDGIRRLSVANYDSQTIQNHAQQFSLERFQNSIRAIIDPAVEKLN